MRNMPTADALLLEEQINVIRHGDDLTRIALAKSLAYKILRTEQARLAARGIPLTPNTYVREDYYPLEITLIHSVSAKNCNLSA